MGQVQQFHVPSSRSPEREDLAAAIERKRQAADRLARINTASEGTFVWDAQEKVERAENNLANARKREPRRLIAGLVGDPASPWPSAEQSEWLLEEAREDLERARRVREALEEQGREAEGVLERSERSLRDAIRKVVQAEGAASKLLDQYREAQRGMDRMRDILSFLSSWDCVPPRWDIRDISPTRAELPWKQAFAALETDADAPLPK